jgi:hypothetical protein
MQLGAHTQLEVTRVPQGEMVVKQSFGSLNVITQQYRESMDDRKEGDGEVEGTNERTNVNYILEKCNYRTVYSIFVDVDPSISSQDCD